MEDSNIDDLLDEAQTLFERSEGQPEEGLGVDDNALLQLRKACRLIEAADHLEQQNGYYTVIVEASFAAFERSIQFLLLERNHLSEEEYLDHETVYRQGVAAGLYGEEFADKLTALWRNNRSETYYREGVATEALAGKMLDLAKELHSHVLHIGGKDHKCICGTA